MMICEDKKSMTLFGEVINFILMKGEKKEWPDLEEKVFEGLKSAGSDLTKIFAYLTAYEGICESRKMLINAKRKPIN